MAYNSKESNKARGLAKAKLTRAEKAFTILLKEETIDYYNLMSRITTLDKTWEEFRLIQNEIEMNTKDEDMQEEFEEASSFENRYYEVKAGFLNLAKKAQNQDPPPQPQATPRQPSPNIKLPKLDLPSFSGDYVTWTSFHDLFSSIIHNNTTLTNCQRLQYLKGCLKGDASKLLNNLQITNDNYDEAWKTLCSRFQNKRFILKQNLKNLFNIPAIQTQSAISLRKIIDSMTETMRGLKVLGLPTDQWDAMVIHVVSEKLDSESKRLWELEQGDQFPTMTEFDKFLETRFRSLEASQGGIKRVTNNFQKPTTHTHVASFKPNEVRKKCYSCSSSEHWTSQCSKLRALKINDRFALVKKLKLCVKCLGADHEFTNCKFDKGCFHCGRNHHALICFSKENKDTPKKPSVESNVCYSDQDSTQSNTSSKNEVKVIENGTAGVASLISDNSLPHQVLLSTAIAKVKDRFGKYKLCRVLLDSGSQANFITEKCIKNLGLDKKKVQVIVNGIGHVNSGTSMATVDIDLTNLEENFIQNINMLVLPKITGQMPSSEFKPSNTWTHIRNLNLADPNYFKPSDIDLLIGGEHFYNMLLEGRLRGPPGSPTAQNSIFGWVLAGKIDSRQASFSGLTSINACHSSIGLDIELKKFWEIENVNEQPQLSKEEKKCEEHFLSTHTRNNDGRYIVKLPIKEECEQLGESKRMAYIRFNLLEKRFDKDPEIKKIYTDFMSEYLQLNHMEKIPRHHIENSDTTISYIPHHMVTKLDSTTTKHRVVFDASAKTSTGVSLNQTMMVGATIQEDLYQILLRFRTHQVAFTADISKMYRQILLHKDHRDLHRILWRSSKDQPIQEYRLCTVTYGTASAPFLATRVLNQLAFDEKEKYPLAAKIMCRDFYVDDLISGASNTSEALEIQTQLINLCKAGGLNLLKWSSNEEKLLTALPPEYRETKLPLLMDSDDTVKALGMMWTPSVDNFSYKVNLEPNTSKITKRKILSEVARLFDPMGLLAPVIIIAKILLQKLWLLELGWDEELPDEVSDSWFNFKNQLPELTNIRIPRCVSIRGNLIKWELFGFCDSSESAYGACIYICSTNENHEKEVNLLTSKTRVAPLKQISLPRLELCGALLLSKLVKKVLHTLNVDFDKMYAFTDSTIVLAWLQKPAKFWNTFVANRVAEIQDLMPPSIWFHVSSKENPADVCSRGLSPIELINSDLWWHGPNWIISNEIPIQTIVNNSAAAKEQRKTKFTALTSTVKPNFDLLDKVSSFIKLQRVTAYILRFASNCKVSSEHRSNGHLTTQELKFALHNLVKIVQQEHFDKEIDSLKNKGTLKKNSKILSLSPFLDKDGLLRVGGRLKNLINVSYDKKHPLLIPKESHLTKLIILHEHINHLHCGAQQLQFILQQKFWIVNSKRTISHVIHNCMTCFRQRASVAQQKMGEIPIHRLEAARPFLRTGLDYGGPFNIKMSQGRGIRTQKAYICLFICMATKAIHLELAGDLTTESFIGCLKRFVGRRGLCSDIFSDNGTNFVGANTELQHLLKLTHSDEYNKEISSYLTNKGINWHFIPPNAPHMGGLWEAGIKSTKKHLVKIMGNALLTFEEFTTLLCQIEAVLNSRPLCSLSTDPEDLQTLTPGHFLIGDALTSIPEPGLTHLKINRLDRWQHVQQILQHFWKRWSTEYLSQLQQRMKWKTSTEGLKVGDLVLEKEDTPPLNWKMARITELHPGKDDLCRVVTIKTVKGHFKRPIHKLCPLPINN